MNNRWMKRMVTVEILAVLACGPVAAGVVEEWSIEVGSMAGHHSNFFYRGEGALAPDEDLYTLYSRGEIELDLGKGKLGSAYDVRGVMTTEIEDSDYQEFDLEAFYKIARTRLTGSYGLSPNKVFSESGEPVYYDQKWTALEVRQTLTAGLWIGAEYEYADWRFDEVESERDASSHSIEGTVRVPLGKHLGLRGSGFREDKEARGPENSWSGQGFSVALEAQPHRRLSVFFRYKKKNRDYEDAPVDDKNFEREDSIQDLVLELRWQVRAHWGFRLEEFHRDGESNREDRNFDANSISGGVFMLIGPTPGSNGKP